MRYPKEFYDELKANWSKSREELQKKRKEIDDKRNEFYNKYYAVKNGINTDDAPGSDELHSQGTRTKQNKERKAERNKIDSLTSSVREEFDKAQETWEQHYYAVAQYRESADYDKVERLNAMFVDLDRAWQEYSDLVKKYHDKYYEVEPLRRLNSDQQVYDSSIKQKEDYKKEFENWVEKNRLFVSKSWDAMAKAHVISDIEIKKQRENYDQKLIELRDKQKENNQEYNINYYSNIKVEREARDLQKTNKRNSFKENLKKYREEKDDYYNKNNSWSRYKEDSLKYRSKQNIADNKFFHGWFENVKKRISNYFPNISESWLFDISLLLKASSNQFKRISVSEIIKSIRSWVYREIKKYSSLSDRYLNEWFESIPDMYAKAKERHNINLNKMNEDYTSSSHNISTISDSIAAISKEHLESGMKLVRSRYDVDKDSNSSRSKLFIDYDEYIKNFFKTRRESRSNQLSQRVLTRSASDAERARIRYEYLHGGNNKKGILALRKEYDTETKNERDEIFQKYSKDIKTLKDNGLTGYARNKYIAMTIRKGWFKVIDLPFKLGRFLVDSANDAAYILRDILVYILRQSITIGSSAYYTVGSGAYFVHMIDRYLIRNSGFISYDFIKTVSRASRDVFDYSFFVLRVASSALGLALYKIPLFYALRRVTNALEFATRVITLPILYLAASVANFAFKSIYFPTLALLGIASEISLRTVNLALAILISIKLLSGTFGLTMFFIGSAALFPIYSATDFGTFAIARVLNVSYRFISRIVMDSAYLGYVISHNIITPISRSLYDAGTVVGNAVGDSSLHVGRKLKDFSHELNEHLYQNMITPALQRMYDVSVFSGRKTINALTATNRGIGSLMFSGYVGTYIFAARVAYVLGMTASDVTYYGGRLVTHTSRFALDRYHGAGVTLNNLVHVRAGVQKKAIKAALVVENSAVSTARVTYDYIGYPVTYTFKNVGIGMGRSFWDVSVNVWRGTQDMCTYSIRGFHDVGHEIDKRISPILISFGRVVEDHATSLGQNVKYGTYKAHDALQAFNIAYMLEHEADQALRDLDGNEDKTVRNRPNS